MAMERSIERAFAVGAGTPPMAVTGQARPWTLAAIEAYRQAKEDGPALAQGMVAAVARLTGRRLDAAALILDQQNGVAWGSLDGITMRWSHARLTIVRPCTHCGTGAFVSEPLRTRQELGYALSDWAPLHHDCQPFVADTID